MPAPGGLLAQNAGKGVRLETDALRIAIGAKGAGITVRHKDSDYKVLEVTPCTGPPFRPSIFAESEFSIKLRQEGARTIVEMAGAEGKERGLVLRQRVAISPTGLIALSYRMEATGRDAL